LALETGRLQAASGCDYDYTVYRSGLGDRPVDVILAHGFLRDSDRMVDLARALAGAGLTTVTLDLCNMRPWNGGHRDNALEMRRVAERLAAPRPIYAGFSAGGLAALLAAADDPDTAGALTLDLVDQAGMGRQAAARLSQPVIGLFGDASSCNADLNGLDAVNVAPRGEVVRIGGATHCDFESPTDGLCRLVCEPEGRSQDAAAERRAFIIEQAVEAAQSMIGVPRGLTSVR
jgi:predicted alpha/beta-hydrolase family hydrolase